MNTYKNKIQIFCNTHKLDSLKYDTSWQEKDIFTLLICELVPKKISNIIPVNDNTYEIDWLNEDYYKELLINPNYIDIIKKLSEYDINLVWI